MVVPISATSPTADNPGRSRLLSPLVTYPIPLFIASIESSAACWLFPRLRASCADITEPTTSTLSPTASSTFPADNGSAFFAAFAAFDSSSVIGKQFGSVLLWTLIWAFFATFLNFFLGTIVALIINRPAIKFKSFWRGCLSMTIAVPQFVSLMVVRSMVQPEGIVNKMLLNAGWISQRLPFLENVTWARVLVIVVNLWVGIPYTIMQVTGILQNIPADQYESARIDGANAFQQFTNITLPYMLFVMTPYLITQFTGNINNFNVIYLLTRGEPMYVGNSAGGTDLLVTWLYKLSVDQQKYNLAAVIGIFTFVVLSIVSLVTYRSSGSYKDEEGFK